MGTRTRSASKAETTRRLQAEAGGSMTPAQEIVHLKRLLAWYVHDEKRYLQGQGEPFGSISTEVGIMARQATHGVSR